jgi:hypothetical protein
VACSPAALTRTLRGLSDTGNLKFVHKLGTWLLEVLAIALQHLLKYRYTSGAPIQMKSFFRPPWASIHERMSA